MRFVLEYLNISNSFRQTVYFPHLHIAILEWSVRLASSCHCSVYPILNCEYVFGHLSQALCPSTSWSSSSSLLINSPLTRIRLSSLPGCHNDILLPAFVPFAEFYNCFGNTSAGVLNSYHVQTIVVLTLPLCPLKNAFRRYSMIYGSSLHSHLRCAYSWHMHF